MQESCSCPRQVVCQASPRDPQTAKDSKVTDFVFPSSDSGYLLSFPLPAGSGGVMRGDAWEEYRGANGHGPASNVDKTPWVATLEESRASIRDFGSLQRRPTHSWRCLAVFPETYRARTFPSTHDAFGSPSLHQGSCPRSFVYVKAGPCPVALRDFSQASPRVFWLPLETAEVLGSGPRLLLGS